MCCWLFIFILLCCCSGLCLLFVVLLLEKKYMDNSLDSPDTNFWGGGDGCELGVGAGGGASEWEKT